MARARAIVADDTSWLRDGLAAPIRACRSDLPVSNRSKSPVSGADKSGPRWRKQVNWLLAFVFLSNDLAARSGCLGRRRRARAMAHAKRPTNKPPRQLGQLEQNVSLGQAIALVARVRSFGSRTWCLLAGHAWCCTWRWMRRRMKGTNFQLDAGVAETQLAGGRGGLLRPVRHSATGWLWTGLPPLHLALRSGLVWRK